MPTLRSTSPPHGPLAWIPAGAPEPVLTARGLYLLKNWPAVIALLENADDLPGAGTILALSQAREGWVERALATFAAAVAAEPEEPHLRCAYASVLIRSGSAEEAARQLEAVKPANEVLVPVWQSLRGAACWRVGQELLMRGESRGAATQFERAATAFVAAARPGCPRGHPPSGSRSSTARRSLAERLAAAYVGQAVAMVAAEQFAAAAQLFARRRAQGMPATPALCRFARDLYELCDLLPRLLPEERRSADAALRPVLAGAELWIQLWDGSHPVTVAWRGIAALNGQRDHA